MRDEAHPEASVYSQSIEIKESMPVVIAEAENLGYHIDEMSIGGGSAGLFGVMAGKEITSDMFGTPEYDEAIKDISALLWIDENTVPSVLAYGKYDKVQSFEASVRLDQALTEHNVPHEYIVCEHSGHGLQNDNKEILLYNQKMEEYLDKYMPVK